MPPDTSTPKPAPIDLSPQQLEGLRVCALMVAHGLRSLDAQAAGAQVSELIRQLAALIGADPAELLERALRSEHNLSLRSVQQSSVAYPKLWERVWRSWASALEGLDQGTPWEAVHPLAFMAFALGRLPEVREGWASEAGYPEPLAGRAEGTAPASEGDPWLREGLKALGKGSLTFTGLQVVTDRAEPLVAHALEAIGQGAYGQAELRLRGALRLDPAHGEARLMLGELLRRTDRLEEARMECLHLLEGEAVRHRLATGPSARLRSMTREARAHLCLARADLVEAHLRRALTHARAGMESLEWSLRHATPDILTEADRAHLQAEAGAAWALLDRLCEQLRVERPARLRP